MKRAKKGFTLIEVICVLVIIAIVAVIAVPSISGYIKRSKINNCQHTMTNFVNDLEYKIVSRRYYDVADLNEELIKYVEANADSYEDHSPPSDLESEKTLTEILDSVKGICPNGGEYGIKWTISLLDAEPNTAKVTIKSCICNCMNDADANVTFSSTHEFMAALISTSPYLKSNTSIDDNYQEAIQKIIDYINADPRGPQFIDDIIADYNNDSTVDHRYEVKGVTVKENPVAEGKNKVEWICVSIHNDFNAEIDPDDKNAYDFITYYPEIKSDGANSGDSGTLQDGDSDGKLVVTKLSENETSDRKQWPPAEGTSGSYLYLEGLNYYNDTYQVADVHNADEIQWLQREKNWYVQKNTSNPGIDTVTSINSGSEEPDHQLKSNSRLNPDVALNVAMDETAINTDFRDIFSVAATYVDEDGKIVQEKIKHLQFSDLSGDNPYDYFINNGYILVSSPSAVNDINWTGVVSEKSDNNNFIENEQRENLKQLLSDEDKIVSDIFEKVSSGVFDKTVTGPNGEERNYNEITIAYQEYYKTFDESGNYTYTPYPSFGTVKIYQKTDENGNPLPGADIIVEKGGVEEAIGSMSVEDISDSYNITYNQSSGSNAFTTDDLKITKEAKCSVLDLNGKVKSSVTNAATLSVAETPNQPNGYYIDDSCNFQNGGSNGTDSHIKIINNFGNKPGTGQTLYSYIYLTGVEKLKYTPIARISSESVDYESLNYSYNKGEEDEPFSLDNVRVSIDHLIKIIPEKINDYQTNEKIKVTVSCNGRIKRYFSRKTDNNPDGFYLTNDTQTTYDAATEDRILKRINDFESSAVIRLHIQGNANEDIKLFKVRTELKSIDEKHKIEKSERDLHYTGLYLVDKIIDAIVSLFVKRFSPFFKVTFPNNDIMIGLEVNANYNISITKLVDGSIDNINFRRKLDHDDNSNRRFYVHDSYSKNGVTLTNENDFLKNRLKSSFVGDIYIYYTDNGVTKYTKFPFSFYEVPEFVYFHDSAEYIRGKEKMHIVAYTGSNPNITIPSKVKGYWTRVAQEDSPCVVLSGTDYYYVDDGNWYNVNYIGSDGATDRLQDILNFNIGAIFSGNSEYNKLNILNESLNGVELNIKIEALDASESDLKICKNAFMGMKIQSIEFPSTLKTISKEAFKNVTVSGNEFVIPESVNEIGENAFYNFKIEKGTLRINAGTSGNTVKSGVFTDSLFNKLQFGAGVTKIDNDAFKNNLSKASLDLGSVQTIGNDAFSGWKNATGYLIVPSTVTSISNTAFNGFASANKQSETYPSLTVNGGSSNKTLSGACFKNSKFKNVTIGGNVTAINANAFNNQSSDKPYDGFVGQLILGSSVNSIGASAFSGCRNFDGSLTLSNNIKSIGASAFNGCKGFTGPLVIPSNTFFTAVNDETFLGCIGFTGDLIIPSNVTSIGLKAFEDCRGLNGTLNLGNRLNSIKAEAFKGLINITGDLIIPQSVTSIGKEAFEGFSSASDVSPSLTINAGSYSNGTALSAYIFSNGHFKDITIGGKVSDIGDLAFRNEVKGTPLYNGLKGSLTIGESVTRIGNNAFDGCAGLDGTLKFDNNSNLTYIGNSAFSGCWFKGNLNIPSKVATIGSEAFYNCVGFNGNLEFSDDSELLSIGDTAFSECNFKGSLIIPSTVTTIGSEAFKNCTGFNGTLKLNEGLKKIGNYAFDGCTHFTGGLTIPSGITGTENDSCSIGQYAFRKFASGVDDQNIGELKIYSGTLSNGKVLDGKRFTEAKFKGVTIGGIVETIDGHAFHHGQTSENGETIADFSGFTGDLVIDNGVNTIRDHAFVDDTGMNSVEIPGSVTSIGASAFEGFGSGTGSLKIYGCSRTEDTDDGVKKRILGKGVVVVKETEVYKCIFNKARFKDVTIGGNVDRIDDEFMYTQPDDLANYDHLGIQGSLTIEPLVQEIGANAFNGDKGFDSVYIPETVVSIGEQAFANSGSGKKFDPETEPDRVGLTIYGCSQIVEGSHVLGNSNDKLFNNAKYNNVTIGGNVEVIANDLMTSGKSGCNHTELTGTLKIESPVNSIGIKSFYGDNGFDSVIIPDTVTVIGDSAFDYSGSGNGSLQIYGYSKENENGAKVLGDGENFHTIFNHGKYRNVTIGGSVEVIGYRFMKTEPYMKIAGTDDLEYDYRDITGDLTITGNVKFIDKEAFNGTGFDGKISFEVEKIVDGKPTVVKSKVETIEEDGFTHLVNASKGITIPESVTYIGERAFEDFSRQSDEPGPLVIKGYSSVKDGFNTIDANRFKYAKFTGVTIDGNVQQIADGFMANYDGAINAPGVTYQGMTGDLIIGNSVQKIGKEAFWDCIMFDGKLTIGNNVSYIGESAFSGCRGLYTSDAIDPKDRKLEIPKSVSYMGKYAFKAVGEYLGTVITETDEKFPALYIYGSSDYDGSLGSGEDHKAIFANSRFKNVTIGGSEKESKVTSIGDNFMDNSKHIAPNTWYYTADDDQWQGQYSYIFGDIEIGESVTSIGSNAFNSVQHLDNAESYTYKVREGDKEVEKVTPGDYSSYHGRLILHEGLTKIGEGAFANTRFFGGVKPYDTRVLTIPSTVTSIGNGAFANFCSYFTFKPTVEISENFADDINDIFTNAEVKQYDYY